FFSSPLQPSSLLSFPTRRSSDLKNDALSPHSNLNDYREKHVRTSYNNRVDDRYIVSPRFFGLFKLVIGMTFANNPMKIMTSFKKDRKSTRLNSSHVSISYAVFCL